MASTATQGCARCGIPLESRFRFCPGCGLPASGEGVLSTQIDELRRRAESEHVPERERSLRRLVLPTVAFAMAAFVLGLGLVLFNRDLLDRVFPTPAVADVTTLAPVRDWEPAWTPIPPGRFPYGPDDDGIFGQIDYEFAMSTFEVPNRLWLEFLQAERPRLEEARIWAEAVPGPDAGWPRDADGKPLLALPPRELDRPVREVSAIAAAAFCRWLTERLDQPGVEIRLPTQLEWEYAARGEQGRTFPWGEQLEVPPPVRTGGETRPVQGIDAGGTFPVEDILDDVSPFGVVAMGSNVSEIALIPDFDRIDDTVVEPTAATGLRIGELAESMATRSAKIVDRNIARRGGNFAHTPDELSGLWAWAKSTSEASAPDLRLGVRLVKIRVE